MPVPGIEDMLNKCFFPYPFLCFLFAWMTYLIHFDTSTPFPHQTSEQILSILSLY